MADNSLIPVASGNETFANEDIAGVKYPTPKLAWGPTGTSNRVDVASGKPLPAQIRSATGLIPIGEPTDAAATATDTTSVSAISLWKQISKSVQLMVFGAGTAAAAQRTTLASDDPAVAVLGAAADAASTTTTIKAALRAIATALGTTALDLGSGTGGSRTLRMIPDSTAVITKGTAGTASADVISMQGIAGMTPVASGGVSALRIITMSTDTSAYASGDLIADTQQYDAFFRVANGTGVINTITVTEKDAQGAAIYIIIHRTSTSMGSENSAPNISDANLVAGIQHIIPVATTDYVTVSGTKIATLKNLGLPVMAVSGTDDLYISILNSTGTPTYASGEIQLGLGVLLD